MVRKIVWTVKAKIELREILSYWNERNQSNTFSIKLFKLIEEHLNLIVKFPHIGRKTDIANVKVSIIHKYLLYYTISKDTIYVLTIRHGSQNPKTLKI